MIYFLLENCEDHIYVLVCWLFSPWRSSPCILWLY